MSTLTRALAAVAATLLAGCGEASPSTDAPCTEVGAVAQTEVLLEYYTFIPRCLRVTTGTPVTYLNLDTVPHTVTTDAGQVETFDSGTLEPGTVFTHTFATAGDIALHCNIIQNMTATVYVRGP